MNESTNLHNGRSEGLIKGGLLMSLAASGTAGSRCFSAFLPGAVLAGFARFLLFRSFGCGSGQWSCIRFGSENAYAKKNQENLQHLFHRMTLASISRRRVSIRNNNPKTISIDSPSFRLQPEFCSFRINDGFLESQNIGANHAVEILQRGVACSK